MAGGAGYFAGGHTGSAPSSAITKLGFSDESAATLSATLPTALYTQAGASAPTRGLLFGGSNGSNNTSTIEDLTFSSEATSSLAASLVYSIGEAAAVWTSTAAYIGTIPDYTNYIIKFSFSDDTSDFIAATLAVGRTAGAGVTASTRGYWGGGYTTGNSYEIDGIQFSDESSVNPSATLSTSYPRRWLAGAMSSANGYFGGGNGGSESDKIDKLVFSNESASLLSATLATSRYGLAGVSSETRGYYGGGYGSGLKTEIDGIQFSDDSAVNPSAALATARFYIAGFYSTPPPPQLLAPVSDVSAGGWTPSSGSDLYAMLDETAASDADYIYATSATTCTLALASGSDPSSSSGHVLRYRLLAGSGTIAVALKQGSTTIASWGPHTLTGSAQDFAQTLSGGQADSITDYTALRAEFTSALT